MAIVSNTVNYLHNDIALEAFFAYDTAISGRRPAVLVNHAWAGRDAFVNEKAELLAGLGYVGFAVDMYGKGILGTTPEENGRLMQPFIDDRVLLLNRLLAAVSAVKLLPWVDDSKIAAIGYCFGGLCVLDLARAGGDVKGVVSFHGLLNAPKNNANTSITAKVLVLHGHDDPLVPVEQVVAFEREMTEAGADWQVLNFGRTMHAFTNPQANNPDFGTVYQVDADRRSWLAMQNFLTELFS